jgi:hypothetical protein
MCMHKIQCKAYVQILQTETQVLLRLKIKITKLCYLDCDYVNMSYSNQRKYFCFTFILNFMRNLRNYSMTSLHRENCYITASSYRRNINNVGNRLFNKYKCKGI